MLRNVNPSGVKGSGGAHVLWKSSQCFMEGEMIIERLQPDAVREDWVAYLFFPDAVKN
jgi:hypothetical protein